MNAKEEPRRLLRTLFDAAVERVDAARAVRNAVRRTPRGVEVAGRRLPAGSRVVVLAVGKAAAGMAAAADAQLGDLVTAGLVVTKEGHGSEGRWPRLEAGHPVPDDRSSVAALAALRLVNRAEPDDVLLLLLSGGASSLITAPLAELRGRDLATTTALLLEAGADIAELNAVRKHLTLLSGGRLAREAASREIEVLAISDVAGDDPAVIGSGPCAADPSRFADALAVLARYALLDRVPAAVREHLESGVAGAHPESVKPGDRILGRVRTHILASNRDAVAAVRATAIAGGLEVHVLPEEIRGEARDAGRRLAALALAVPPGRSRLLVAGGETTVTVRGDGRGGRSQELALAAAMALDGSEGVTLLAAGTDGGDGPTDAAGAFVDGGSVARGRAAGAAAATALERNDAYGFFHREGGLLVTGPTGTNVRDLVLIHRA